MQSLCLLIFTCEEATLVHARVQGSRRLSTLKLYKIALEDTSYQKKNLIAYLIWVSGLFTTLKPLAKYSS